MRAVLHRLTARVDRGSGGADGLFRVTQGNAWLQLGRTVELVLDLPAVRGRGDGAPRGALRHRPRVRARRAADEERPRWSGSGNPGPAMTGGHRVILRSPELKPNDRLIVTHLPNAIDGLKVKVAGAPPG